MKRNRRATRNHGSAPVLTSVTQTPIEKILLEPAHLLIRSREEHLPDIVAKPENVRTDLQMHWNTLQASIRNFQGNVKEENQVISEISSMIVAMTKLALFYEHNSKPVTEKTVEADSFKIGKMGMLSDM